MQFIVGDVARRQIDVIYVAAQVARKSSTERRFACARWTIKEIAASIGNTAVSEESFPVKSACAGSVVNLRE